MKVLVYLMSIVVIASCSVMTKNMVRKGDLTLRGGVIRDKKWDESLYFKRTSWYHELTLGYDLLIVEMNQQSPFWEWLSASEKKSMSKCVDSKVMMHYSWDTSLITYQQILRELKDQGIETMALPHFHSQVKMHPNFSFHSLRLYKLFGMCFPKKDQKFSITVPGHNTVVL